MKNKNHIKSREIDKALNLLYIIKDKSENVIKAIELLENEQLNLLLLDLSK
jgi:hypothetical protein